MKPKLILISHGHYGEQVYESAKMVIGEIEGLYNVAMLANDGLEGTRGKMKDTLDEIGPDVPILIIADMFFGTPCNISVETMCSRENVRLLTGLNLPMVMEYAVAEVEDLDELAQYLHEVGTGSIQIVPKPDVEVGEEGYED